MTNYKYDKKVVIYDNTNFTYAWRMLDRFINKNNGIGRHRAIFYQVESFTNTDIYCVYETKTSYIVRKTQ